MSVNMVKTAARNRSALRVLFVLLSTPVAMGHGGMSASNSSGSSIEGILVVLLIIAGIFIISFKIKRLKTLPQRLSTIMIFLLVWEIAVRTGMTSAASIPTASFVINGFIHMIILESFWEHTMISLQRVFSGYALAVMIAIPLGFAVGWFRTIGRYLDPLLQTFRQVPLFALFPLFILFFGIGEFPKTLLIMLAAVWWILLNTISAVQDVDPYLVKTARSVGASQWDILRKIVTPSAIPSIFTGLRYASTEVILVLVAVEWLGARNGLGLLLDTPRYWEVLVFMTMLGVIANYILIAIERKLCIWKEKIEVG